MRTLVEAVPINGGVDPRILEDAEIFLAEVKAGKVSSYALAYREKDGGSTTMFKSRGHAYFLIGLLHVLQSRITSWIEED